MTTFVALVRAMNVGGTGMLPMARLRTICSGIGLSNARTYIQSGNVVFDSRMRPLALTAKLEQALSAEMGKPVDVMVRAAADLRDIVDANPFPDADPARVGVVFLPEPSRADALTGWVIPGREEVRQIGREIFIHYPDGMGRSKLKLPAAAANGTTRNLNTIRRLLAMVEE